MSLISEGPIGRDRESSARPAASYQRPRQATGPAANGVRASQARAALLREARRDEQAVASWLRQLSRSTR